MATINGTNNADVLHGVYGDTIYGYGGADQITGGELLFGGSGNDTLTSAASSPSWVFLDGGAGDDVLNGNGNWRAVAFYYDAPSAVHVDLSIQNAFQNTVGAGLDKLMNVHNVVGSVFNDTLIGGAANEGFAGGPGDDIINGGGGFNLVDYSYDTYGGVSVDLSITGPQNTGTWGFDTITNIQAIAGSNFNDVLSGDNHNNLILGLGGDDLLDGRGGDDTLDGGGGDNMVTYYDAPSAVTVSLLLQGVAQNTGGSGKDLLKDIENLTGSAFNDSLIGDAQDNVLLGLGGDDTIEGGRGTNILDGGTGVNTASYAHEGAGVSVSLAAQMTFQFTYGGGFDYLVNFQNLTGSVFSDSLSGDGGANLIQGLGGNDALYGGGGNDTLDGGSGDDTLDGGTGNNTASYADAASAVTVSLLLQGSTQNTHGAGSDRLSSIQNLIGSNFADTLIGDGNANVISGGSGDDTITGGAGNDTIYGGTGTDTFVLSGPKAHYTITPIAPGSYTVTDTVGTDGTDQIVNVEKIQFSDSLLSLVGNIIGTSGSDSLTGTVNGETIYGLAGDDTLVGLGGNDVLYGGDGNDTLDGGVGNDTLDGGTGTNTASYADAGGPVSVSLLLEGVAQNTKNGGLDVLTNIQNLTGSNFADVLIGDGNANVLIGGAGDDTITGGAGDDTIDGGTGTDTLILSGHKANYTITPVAPGSYTVTDNVGTDGTDHIANIEKIQFSDSLLSLVGNIIGTSGNNLLTGTANGETIYGLGGDDTLNGLGGNDVLYGGDGNDTLDGGAGDDTLDGGTGTNTASYADAGAAVTVSLLLQGSAQNTHGAGSDTLSNIQNLTGSAFADTLTGNAGANVISGGAGDDTITGGAGDDTIDGGTGTDTLVLSGPKANYTITATGPGAYTVTDTVGSDGTDHIVNVEKIHFSDTLYTLPITGWTGNDSLTGTTGDDVINGLGGDDVLVGLSGNDQLYGGDGDDTLDGGLGNDTLDGGAGNNTASYADAALGVTVSLALQGSSQNTKNAGLDTLVNIQNLIGSAHNDLLTGDANNNTLEGGAGDDTLVGGGGTDTASYASAGSGVTVSLAITTAQATGGAGTDTLTGISNLIGSAHADVLTGNSGNNVLTGGAGDDSLIGGLGVDTLTGGLGADRFVFKTLADSTVATPDTITDFSHAQGDKINLTAIDANTNVSGDQAFTLVASFTHVAGQLIQVAQAGGYLVEGDVNGDGVADFAIMVHTSAALLSSDFLL